jgi:hypothetical protein
MTKRASSPYTGGPPCQTWANCGRERLPDLGPHDGPGLSERGRVLGGEDAAVGVVVDEGELRPRPQADGVRRVEHGARRDAERRRPGVRPAERRRAPVERAREGAHLARSGEELGGRGHCRTRALDVPRPVRPRHDPHRHDSPRRSPPSQRRPQQGARTPATGEPRAVREALRAETPGGDAHRRAESAGTGPACGCLAPGSAGPRRQAEVRAGGPSRSPAQPLPAPPSAESRKPR